MVAAVRRGGAPLSSASPSREGAVVVPRRPPRRVVGVLSAWLLSRVLLVAAPHLSGSRHNTAYTGDVRLYARWGRTLAGGHFPVHDPSWQYPPGAGAVLALPELLPGGYRGAFVTLMLGLDAAVLAVLIARGRHGSPAGAWVWVVGTTALGPIVLNRFDTAPTLLAVCGLAVALAVPGRPLAAGVLLGLGAVVKVWPAVLLPATRDRGRAVVGALIAGLGTLGTLALTGRMSAGLDFLHNQRARGLQIETLAATPYVLARAFGASGVRVVHEYGAFQVIGPGVSLAVTVTGLLGGAVVLTYLLLARRRPADLGLGVAALLAVLVTARVLSPQYLIWALGVVALDVAGDGSRQRGTAVLLVLSAALTQWLYPFSYDGLLHGALGSALLLAARNGLLVAACVVALRAAPRGSPGPPRRSSSWRPLPRRRP